MKKITIAAAIALMSATATVSASPYGHDIAQIPSIFGHILLTF